mmetsp:Transcript_96648/g.295614  ORF Transcript_96648/g.295614 Transcript_96648/m.295614 type:complete len:109 (-) Transcript_96648:129-455(-)
MIGDIDNTVDDHPVLGQKFFDDGSQQWLRRKKVDIGQGREEEVIVSDYGPIELTMMGEIRPCTIWAEQVNSMQTGQKKWSEMTRSDKEMCIHRVAKRNWAVKMRKGVL